MHAFASQKHKWLHREITVRMNEKFRLASETHCKHFWNEPLQFKRKKVFKCPKKVTLIIWYEK